MPKLHEIIAVTVGKKGIVEKAVTDSYHQLQKPELFDGHRKTYRPVNENPTDADKLPPDNKNASLNLAQLVKETAGRWSELFDITFTLDKGNQVAKADIVVEGGPTIKDVPVPTLLFLEKQLENMRNYVEKMPTPDPSYVWTLDANQGLLASAPEETFRSKKVQKALLMYPATTEHPAQTQLITEDVTAGIWTTIRYTSRMPANVKATILDNLSKLTDAVKVAREKANAADVEKYKMGAELVGFVFGAALK